ncbi:hypothetical protein [Arhodomonas sp. SL1]|uniref:hypothetical protein n=1 Tax=Arhodomonas sp. SL1 TaxID=3425691 RepID=UPI003F882A95
MRILVHAGGYPLTRESFRYCRRRVKAWVSERVWPGRVLVEPVAAGSEVICRVRLEWRGGGLLRAEARAAALEPALEGCLGALREWAPAAGPPPA